MIAIFPLSLSLLLACDSIFGYMHNSCLNFIHSICGRANTAGMRESLFTLRATPALDEEPVVSSGKYDIDVEMAKVFNKLAEKKLLLDVPGAGTIEMSQCCHSGCDNCEFARIFDEMNSGRAKWIPTYGDMKHVDNRNHVAKWMNLFVDDADEFSELETLLDTQGNKNVLTISMEDLMNDSDISSEQQALRMKYSSDEKAISFDTFRERLESLKSVVTMGPPSGCTGDIDTGFLKQFYDKVLSTSKSLDACAQESEAGLTPRRFSVALVLLSQEPYGMLYSNFCKVME